MPGRKGNKAFSRAAPRGWGTQQLLSLGRVVWGHGDPQPRETQDMTHGLGMWLRGEVLVRHVRAWGLLLGTSKTEGGSRTRLELRMRKALCPRCPEKGRATASQKEGEKVTRGEAHHWSRPGGIASRLVLSSDGGLGPEARVTLALEEVPVDGGQGYPEWKQVQGSFHHTRRVSRQFWVWTTLQRPRGREAMLRTSTLPRAALYHTSQSLEQLRDRLGMRTLGRGTASAPSPQF